MQSASDLSPESRGRTTTRRAGLRVVRRVLAPLVFVLCSASVVVFWSEKAYWYVQGWIFVESVFV